MSDAELAAAVGGPVDDWVQVKVMTALKTAIQTVTDPARLAESLIASGWPIPPTGIPAQAMALSIYLRAVLAPLVK